MAFKPLCRTLSNISSCAGPDPYRARVKRAGWVFWCWYQCSRYTRWFSQCCKQSCCVFNPLRLQSNQYLERQSHKGQAKGKHFATCNLRSPSSCSSHLRLVACFQLQVLTFSHAKQCYYFNDAGHQHIDMSNGIKSLARKLLSQITKMLVVKWPKFPWVSQSLVVKNLSFHKRNHHHTPFSLPIFCTVFQPPTS